MSLNYLYKRTNVYSNQYLDIKKIQNSLNNNVKYQIVNLGSNHPKFALDYSVSSMVKGANWAVGPQTFEYDFAILKNNVQHLAPGAVVVIPVCLLNFFLYRQKLRAIHAKYYNFLPKEDIVKYSVFEKFMNVTFPIIKPLRLRFLLKDIKKDSRLDYTSNPMTSEEQLNKDASYWVDVWNKQFDIKLPEPRLSDFNISEILNNIRVLREMLNYCVKNNLKPVIAILPVTDNLSSQFSNSFIDNHIIKYINEANSINAPLMNYLKDQRFADSSLYINSFFMNKKGREIFTKQFLNDLHSKSLL